MTKRKRGSKRKRGRDSEEGVAKRKRGHESEESASKGKRGRESEEAPVKDLKFNLNQLYERGKKLVWVLKMYEDAAMIKGKNKGKNKEEQTEAMYMTAFSVDESGLIMSCSHGYSRMKNPKFEARNIESNVWYKAILVEALHKCDVSILKLEGSDSIEAARMGSGEVAALEKLLMIGNPEFFVGSGVVGRACYPCLKNPNFSLDFSDTCESHECRTKDVTPSHRVMGDLYNDQIFEAMREREEIKIARKRFQGQLLKDVPIIQLAGLVAGHGSSGSPLFNYQGEVVGMVHGGSRYQTGIHVSVLKLFLQKVQKSNILPTTGMHQGHLQLSKATAGVKWKNDSNYRSEGPSTS